jgi:uncharacterized protein YuzE
VKSLAPRPLRSTDAPICDEVYIYFRVDGAEVTTKEIVEGEIFFDYDADDRLVGIEILDATKVLADPAAFKEVSLEMLGG